VTLIATSRGTAHHSEKEKILEAIERAVCHCTRLPGYQPYRVVMDEAAPPRVPLAECHRIHANEGGARCR